MRADEIIFEATTNKTRKGYMSREVLRPKGL